MPANTDFNVSPYWDDFNIDNDFYRVLFRPGFAVQARELTTLQTILQNQIEQFGNHFFKEGTIVIPGSVAYDENYYAVKVQSSFGSNTVSTYLEQYTAGTWNSVLYEEGAIITGATSGVKAQVIGYAVATTAGDPDTLFVKYRGTNTGDNVTTTFTDDETLSADRPISSYVADQASVQLLVSSASATGSAASVTEGIFFVHGFMCRTTAQTITLDKYSNTPSYRIGFNVIETLVTPEDDASLLDNAQGSSNYAAKGAHRFKITLTLVKKELTATDDTGFIELARVDNGNVVHRKKATEYSIVADMIARRTADESGDYVVKHFDIEPRENLNDGTNRGIYTAAQGGVETKDTLVISPGKAYVNGYEIDKMAASFVNIDKARTTKAINNDNVPFNLGNYTKVDNVYSQPDISLVTTALDPFKKVTIYDKQTTATRGAPSGTPVGEARSRSFGYGSGGAVGAANATYHHYLFDVSMYTKISLTANATTLTATAVITGVTSGATGILVTTVSSASEMNLMQVEGAFLEGEAITSSIATDTPGIGLIQVGSGITTYDFGASAKQIYGDNTTIDYTSDVILDQSLTLTGEVSTASNGATAVTGTNTKFLTELNVLDVIELPSGAAGVTEEFRVGAITSDTALTIELTGTGTANATNQLTSAKATRIRAKIAEEEETVLVYKMPKENIESLLTLGVTDTSYTFRKQFVGTTAAGAVSFSAGTGEDFDSTNTAANYTLTITVAGTGNGLVGDIIDLSSTKAASTIIQNVGTQTITITDSTIMGNGCQVVLMASITTPGKIQKSKLAVKMATKTIAATLPNVYGERVSDATINLSYSDVYKLHSVYESVDISTAPVAPALSISNSTGTFTVGEIITGSTSGATGRVIINSPSTTVQYVVLTGIMTTNDTIVGGTSGYTASVTAVGRGDRNITSNWQLDTGQRDSFYDLGRGVRRPDAVTPVGQLLFVYDYFNHGAGDYFSVDSYTGQVDYKDIPEYSASKVDPESKAPVGFYELRDCLDFRPSVQDQTAPSTTPFAFNNKNFEGTGSAGNLVIPDANVRSDFTFYLGRLDLLYLDTLGNFLIRKGIPAEDPRWPQTDNNNMLIAKISIAPYTFDAAKEIIMGFAYVRRYTMRDIGKLHTRIGNLEYATALGLLERQTDSFQVLDDNGLDRFKSGFIVDTFYGHNLGLVNAADYSCSMDPALGHLRPQASQYMTKLIEENTTDSQRTSSGYAKTGDIITLPYTHVADTIQPYASRIQNVNPFNVTLWVGQLTLAPDTDIWIDTERAPSITMNVEGNYEQLLREQGGQTTTGMIWDDWNTTWTGNRRSSGGGRSKETNPNGSGAAGNLIRWVTTDSTTSFDRRQERTGSNTRLVERIDTQSTGDRVTNIEIVPWIRPSQVNFTVTGMKPNTRVYAFFDRVDVNAECKPILTSANSTTLNGALTKTATTVTVASTTGFPTTGTIGVGAIDTVDWQGVSFKAMEQMTYTGTTATTFTGITRNTGNSFIEPQEWATATIVSNETYGTSLVSDSAGNLYGRFEIPNTETKRFRIGTRTFRLTDSSTNSLVPGSVETAVEGPYVASGMIQTKQEVIFNVRNGTRNIQTTTQTRADTVTTGGGVISRGPWYDPLAQSLMCDSENGMFVTKVDIFFQAKDDTLPVWVELRTVRDGYPSQEIFPFSKIVKTPAEINLDVAGTANTATTFVFDAPIYIQNNQEYCVVIASNSAKYKLWICRLGDTEIGGTRTISSQPTLGSLFKSQNASTWEPSQYEDLKFTIYKAKYDTAAAGSFVTVNEELKTKDPNELTAIAQPIRLGGGKTAGIPTLSNNPIDTSSGVTSLTLTAGGTGYTSAPAVTFTGGSGTGAAAIATISGGIITALTITDPGVGYITTPTISFVGGGGGSATATATISSTSVRVKFRDHGMYDIDNNVLITGAISDISGSALNGAIGAGTTGTVSVDSSTLWPTAGYVRIDDEIIYYGSKPGATSISITTRGVGTTTAAAHEDNSLVELYMLGGIPLTEINTTHTSISGIETDSFIITTTTAATATVSGGGEGVQCSRNIHMDVMQPLIQIMELPSTEVTGKVQTTTSSSPSGAQSSFTRTAATSAYDVPLNEDYYFDAPQMIASKVNETAELAGNKSFRLTSTLTSTDENVSPQIDTSRMGVLGIGNRLNEIDSSTNVGALTPYHAMTASSGDNNNTIYITKKITLSQSATALQVLLDAVKMAEGDIKILYKTLRTDSAENFNDIEWSFFNTTGAPDSTVTISKTRNDFKEYRYFAGKNALGVGTELNEFIAFAIKIVLQGSNTSLPPLIKDFRAIAFQA